MEILLGIKICAIAIIGDTILGWVLAFSRREFNIREAPRFLQTAVLPYMGSLLLVAAMAYFDPDYMGLFIFVCGLITAKFGVEAIKDKILGYFNL